MGPRRNSTMELFQEGQDADIEYFFASDASAIIEHTNRVIYLEVKNVLRQGCGMELICPFMVLGVNSSVDGLHKRASKLHFSYHKLP